MYRNTHASVGQNQGRALYAPTAKTSASPQLCRGFVLSSSFERAETSTGANPRQSRGLSGFPRGISLTEVLIAMGILTVGLLGVAAIFPVGSFYMQKGDVADRSSAIAQAAFNEAISRGTLNPENWLVWHDSTVGVTTGFTVPPNVFTFTFTRPFADMLRKKKAVQLTSTMSPAQKQQEIAREFGSIFIIDPAGIASVAQYDQATSAFASMTVASTMAGNYSSGSPAITSSTCSEWQAWNDPSRIGTQWPVRRVTLRGVPAGSAQAAVFNRLFSTVDDLAMEMPVARDKPSIQRLDIAPLDLNGDGNTKNDPLMRQSRGDYSWIVTVSPTTAQARDALATDPSAESYEVSVVVFYKRPLGVKSPTDADERIANFDVLRSNERSVRARVVSTGVNGGEVLLEKFYLDPQTESPFAILKTGQWVLLCGPHPNTTDARPMMTSRWYRVLAIDGKESRLNSVGTNNPVPPTTDPERRLVALRGPQWPWEPATNATGNPDLVDTAKLSNALYVCIPTGAVAVHSKTIHLQGSSAWSGGANGFTVAPPPGPTYAP